MSLNITPKPAPKSAGPCVYVAFVDEYGRYDGQLVEGLADICTRDELQAVKLAIGQSLSTRITILFWRGLRS